MAFLGFQLLFLLTLLLSSSVYAQKPAKVVTFGLKRSDFPKGFLFGSSSAAYQYEGAANVDGKGKSIWDTFTHTFPEKIADRSTGDVAEDFYHRYKEDIKLMKSIGLTSFRMSLSWTRIIPTGNISDGVNQKGIDFYNNVINELLANGIEPMVTIFHWDLPQHLEDAYGGFLSPKITMDFLAYANLCFKKFGDRVKLWATVNEPSHYAYIGYDFGVMAPGRCSPWRTPPCPAGNSGTEPYIVAHHLLIAHAATVKLYREKYKPYQKGQIGLVFGTREHVPLTKSEADRDAARRATDFLFGWFADPVTHGDYPENMKRLVGKRLPRFTPAEAKLLKGSCDYFGLNYYTALYVSNSNRNVGTNLSYTSDSRVQTSANNSLGRPIGDQEGTTIFHVYPKGIRRVILYAKRRYNNPVIYVTENGYVETGIEEAKVGVMDPRRVAFFRDHLKYVKQAMEQGANVKGYYPWTFLDAFEWTSGYDLRFGLVFIDRKNGLKRTPKLSALTYKKFLHS